MFKQIAISKTDNSDFGIFKPKLYYKEQKKSKTDNSR